MVVFQYYYYEKKYFYRLRFCNDSRHFGRVWRARTQKLVDT